MSGIHSFRFKTIAGVALIEAVLLFILIVSSLHFLRVSNEEELQKRASTTARLFAATAKDAVLGHDLASLASIVNEVLATPGVAYARVLDLDGRVLAQAGPAEVLKRPFTADTSVSGVSDGVFDTTADVLVGGTPYGRVQLGLGIGTFQEIMNTARSRTVGIAVIELMLVGLFSYFLGLYLTRGLHALSEGTERLARGELGYTVKVQGRDELARTASAFNDMSLKLKALYDERQRAEEALAALNADLERRVELRTQQLAEANQELERQALHDSLTKLPNRVLFHDRLQQGVLIAKREQKPLALMVLDLDGFKEINDTHGHHAGDLVLQEVAKRIPRILRQSDTVARLGGDEFAVVLPAVAGRDAAAQVAEKLLAALERPILVDGEMHDIGGSLGVALYPDDADNATLLIQRADTAMYAAKRNQGRFVFYDAQLEQGIVGRASVATDLKYALRYDQLVVHYQPKVDFQSGRVTGMEALLRWQHPKHGLLFPADFLEVAERTGLIVPIARWVLDTGLKQVKRWREEGHVFSVSINIATQNLLDPDFPEVVSRSLAHHGLPPEVLELEVSETALMVDPSGTIAAIKHLAGVGVQIAIDDFGTGYSSLAYIRKLPVAKIKIDRSFVLDMTENNSDATIVRSIIGLGHNLGLSVVAEGVETSDAWNQLRQLGCDAGQGYCVSRPMSPALLEDWLKRHQAGDHTKANPGDA